jgi:hypothetical protein
MIYQNIPRKIHQGRHTKIYQERYTKEGIPKYTKKDDIPKYTKKDIPFGHRPTVNKPVITLYSKKLKVITYT